MTDIVPTLKPKPMAFFSDWYVEVRWPDGQTEKVSGFSSEHHALGWIEHESPGWLAMNKKSYRGRSAPVSATGPQAKPAAAQPPLPKGVALAALTAQFEAASQTYAADNAIDRDPDWFVLKLQEELGELTQAWMKLTGRGRPRGASDEDLRTALADETADLLGHVLLFANAQGVDLDKAIERKWLFKPGD
jgi:NTP pyrophosphatase (non-canonical NTP hydrolase)